MVQTLCVRRRALRQLESARPSVQRVARLEFNMPVAGAARADVR